MVVTLVAIMIMAGPVKANGDPYESAPTPPPAPPASNLVSFLLGEEWTSPQGVAAAIGSGLVAELTGVITVPLTWAWRALFLVPDAIDPGRAPQVEAALAEVVGQSLTDPVFDAVGVANGVQTAWAQARQLALSAERPFLGLVLGTFAIWALVMLFIGRPVDLAAAAGRLGIALIGSLASFQFVDALLQIDDLLVTLFSQIGDGQVLQRTPLALIEAWDWGSETDSATNIGGGFVKGIWYGLFRAFLQLLLLLGMAAIAARLLIRLVWIWTLTIVAPLVLVLSVLPPAQRLPVIWLKKLLRVVFEKAALALSLSVVFSVISLQPPGLLTVALAIAGLFCALAFPNFLLDSLAGAGTQSAKSVVAATGARIAQMRSAGRMLNRPQ